MVSHKRFEGSQVFPYAEYLCVKFSSPNCLKLVTIAFSFHVSGGVGSSSVKKPFSLATVTKLSFHIFKLSNLWALFNIIEKTGQQCVFNIQV